VIAHSPALTPRHFKNFRGGGRFWRARQLAELPMAADRETRRAGLDPDFIKRAGKANSASTAAPGAFLR